MKTSQLFLQDNQNSVTMLHSLRFDSVKCIAAKRTPTLRPTLVNPTQKNPKHAAVLAESGITYDTPLNPEKVAAIRAERIQQEKKKGQVLMMKVRKTRYRYDYEKMLCPLSYIGLFTEAVFINLPVLQT